MTKEQRIKYFTGILENKTPHGSMELYYKGGRKTLPVYEIDLQYLVYNPYNGRIASLVKSYERQEGIDNIDSNNPNHILKIKEFLKASNEDAYKATKTDIGEKKQLKYGIVTKDGVIIDGNRRASILEEIAKDRKDKPVYFLAVVLDEELNENPREIMRLETTYQMGEDAKVDYNAIEKYLKCKDLMNAGFDENEIGKMMTESSTKIEEYLSILQLMEEYLIKFNCAGIYTRLDKTEGAFVDVNNYLDRYKGERSKLILWKYKDSDLSDLKLVYFDYIRAIYNKNKKGENDEGVMGNGDSKDYRFIGQTSKKGSIFSNKDLWDDFKETHFKNIDPIRVEFEEGNYSLDKLREENPTEKLDTILKERDKAWQKETTNLLKKNLGQSRYKLSLKNDKEKPMELLKRAKDTLESIDISEVFPEDLDVLNIIKDISSLMWDYQQTIKHNGKKK